MKTKFLFFLFLVSSPMCMFAQFEQKVTLNAGGLFVYPEINVKDYQYNFGAGINGGLQYNFNRTFSMTADVRFYYMDGIEGNTYTDNLAVGLGLKANLRPSRVFNPYLFAEANVNFLWWEEWIDPKINGEDVIPGYYYEDFATSIGGLGGLGFDLRLGDNFSLFIQSGFYYTYYDGLLNNLTQAGVRINMFKSKTI